MPFFVAWVGDIGSPYASNSISDNRLACFSAVPCMRSVCSNVGRWRGLEVEACQRNEFITIRLAQSRNHADMITARSIERVRERIGIGSNPINFLRELLDRFDEACVAAQLKQRPVKLQIAVKYG